MPVHSMTAYGYGEYEDDGLTYTCEVRTLNSRYLEASVRLPRHLLALEVDIINHVKSALKRGKADVFIDTVRSGAVKDPPALDLDAARHYLNLAAEVAALARSAPVPQTIAPLSFTEFARLDGVLVSDRVRTRGLEAAELHRAGVFSALDGALKATSTARRKKARLWLRRSPASSPILNAAA